MQETRRLRSSRQRDLILQTLRSVDTHPTADELYGMVRTKMPRISLGTVYRNLDVLSDHGEIQKIELAGTQRHYDGTPEPHLHVRCERCDRVADVPGEAPSNLPSVVPEGMGSGFRITGYHFELTGVCPECDKG